MRGTPPWERLGFRPLLTDSNGRGGYHLVVSFRAPVPAALVYTFLRWLTDDHAAHGLTSAPEHFPKQPALTGKRFGNWLRLPGAHHSQPHYSLVWDGSRWLAGAEAVAYLLHLDGDDPAFIPLHILPPDPARRTRRRARTPGLMSTAAPFIRPRRTVNGDGRLPGDLLNRLGTWPEILEPAGWKFDHKAGDEEHWTRPGKDGGTSATLGFCHTEHAGSKLYVFTSNALPFEADHSYSKFAAYALLQHGGDFHAAAAALARRFGLKPPPRLSQGNSRCRSASTGSRPAKKTGHRLTYIKFTVEG